MSLVRPERSQTHTFKELQSKFISMIHPIDDVTDFKPWLASLRKEYYDASHVCWAYRIQCETQLEENSSDAGEPSGTAGLPILNAMKQNNLVNSAIAVIRYFGGTKLGKRGLIDAYGLSARDVIGKTKCHPWIELDQYVIQCPIRFYGDLSQALIKIGAKINDDRSGESLNWLIEIKTGNLNNLIQMVRSLTKGEGELEKL